MAAEDHSEVFYLDLAPRRAPKRRRVIEPDDLAAGDRRPVVEPQRGEVRLPLGEGELRQALQASERSRT